jgi:3-phosphoshikimate 1-carboxyvinyltransferase
VQSATKIISYTRLKYRGVNETVEISLPGSKSISNRLLILQKLSGNGFNISGLSEARDTQILSKLLSENGTEGAVEDAGTAARFGLAWACVNNKSLTLSGTQRLHQRPMAPLIHALKQLGFTIEELEKTGHFPVSISPVSKATIGNRVSIEPEVSSQFVSALCLIGPFLPQGLRIQTTGKIPSSAYIKLTLDLMRQLGFSVSQNANDIDIKPFSGISTKSIIVERDWSSAAFWYEYVALSGQPVLLRDLSLKSLQGDVRCAEIFKELGVKSTESHQGILIEKMNHTISKLDQNFQNCPDLAQPFLFTCSVLGTTCIANGLETLKHKETDRINAMKQELCKLDSDFEAGDESFILRPGNFPQDILEFNTYKDHRMVMSLTMLLPILESLKLNDTEEVAKSYPGFWDEAKKVGIEVEE